MAKLYIKETEAFVLNAVKQMPNAELNVPLYEDTFKKMTQEHWEKILERFKAGKFYFPIIVDNMGKARIDEHKVMKFGKTLGIEYFQHCILTDHVSGERYTTPIKYLVLDLPGRRLIQHILDKMSTAEHSRVTDHLAGQATGASKASSISSPELTVMNAKELTVSPLEFMKVRGGDAVAFEAALKEIEETGTFSMENITKLGSKPKAVETLDELLLATYIQSNLQGMSNV
ncbi:virion structural protein [Vibrio phage C-ZP2022]|nr:virion structural protein [Vibrio phage C-ZP2022]